ncbi:MAG: glycosyltransferase 87 family protein [Bacteroidota bacterium]
MLNYLLAFLILTAVTYLGYGVAQGDFWQMSPAWLVAFLSYGVVYGQKTIDLRFWLVVAVLLRLILVFSFPNLSDDIYRFVWDGRLILEGVHPFAQLPSELIQSASLPKGITPELYAQLNSPNYYTIYPPLAQLVFLVSTWLSPGSVFGTALVMKGILFVFEIGTIVVMLRLLQTFQLPPKTVLLYALNPLIMIELVGNLHFEGVMIFFLLLAIWLLTKVEENRYFFVLSAVCFALSIVAKLLPLMFLPLLIRPLGWRKSIAYLGIVGAVIVLSFLPLIDAVFIQNLSESLDLYFRKFEFNASVYYLLREIGYLWRGYNLIAVIGPALAMMSGLSILVLSYFRKADDWRMVLESMLFAISIYLLLTTTVHPWYSAMPLALCVFTRFRYPVVWTALIWLTYINYSQAEYQEQLWIVVLEYGVVLGLVIWEFLKHRRAPKYI